MGEVVAAGTQRNKIAIEFSPIPLVRTVVGVEPP
jgi:hypothetical protein